MNTLKRKKLELTLKGQEAYMSSIAAKQKSSRSTQAREYSSSTMSNYRKNLISNRFSLLYLPTAKFMAKTYRRS